MSRPLHDLSENELIAKLKAEIRTSPGAIGIGDDCAVLAGNQLLKTDSVIEGRHYLATTPSAQVGRKALARVMSDFAAMGGEPDSFLITCGLRASSQLDYLLALYRSMDALCAQYGGYIVGGETCTVPEHAPQFFSISGYAHCPQAPILRSGAAIGNLLYVTGDLGNSLESSHHLNFTPRLQEAAWLVQNARPSAMMDLSDGLAQDLPRLATASGVGYSLNLEALPLRKGATTQMALQDGEDYELLFSLPPEFAASLAKAPFTATLIGSITKDTPNPLSGGWDHLAGKDA